MVRSGSGDRRPIERVGTDRRVATPEPSADRPGRHLDPAAQRVVRLHVVKDGQELRLAFLRPAALVGHLSAGDTVFLDIFELQVKGPARVLGVDPCPPLEEGAGRLVTGTAVSDSVDVLRVKLAGLADPLEVTGNHPVFSEDHQEFVTAKSLRVGGRLRRADGTTATVTSLAKLPGRWTVFNLEVEGAHQYYVTDLDLLVHNNSGIAGPGSTPGSATVPEAGGWIRTEPPEALDPGAVDQYGQMARANDPYLWKDPVYTTRVGGQRYLLDGHHRLTAVTDPANGYTGTIPYIDVPSPNPVDDFGPVRP